MKSRYVNTKFWNDLYIASLETDEKLLFLYLITNIHVNLCGVYEISVRQIAFDTAVDEEKINNTLVKFEKDGRMVYRNGYLYVKNFQKHQNVGSPKIQKGIESALAEVPQDIMDAFGKPGVVEPEVKTSVVVAKEMISEAIESVEKDDYQEVEIWNSFANKHGFPKVATLTGKRKTAIRARRKEKTFDLYNIFDRIVESDFLMGKGRAQFKLNFDFVFCSPNNYIKILEGNYGVKRSSSSDSDSIIDTALQSMEELVGSTEEE